MGAIGGGFLRLFQTFLYALAFCASAVIIGFYSYFLAVLSDRNEYISKDWKAVEGISGIAVVYTICAIVLTCCLGGVSFFAFLAMFLNVCFCIGFIAIAVLTRHGATSSCTGNDATSPLGSGSASASSGTNDFGLSSSDTQTHAVTYGHACKYNKAAFACAVIGAFLFLILTFTQLLLVRHQKKEKAYGPSPANNYTSGTGRRKFWQRGGNKKRDAEVAGAVGAGGLAAHHHNKTHNRDVEAVRPSHDTAYTGSTVASPQTGLVKDAQPVTGATGNTGATWNSTHGGYYTQPQGTGVNPYGYENTNTKTTANF